MRIRNWTFVLFLALLSACSSRGPAAIGEDAIYALEISNPNPHLMNVSLNVGTGMLALGAVEPGQTRRFTVRDPGTNDVLVVATDPSGEHRIEKQVELSRREVAKVTIST